MLEDNPHPFDDADADRLGSAGFVVKDGWLGAAHATALLHETKALHERGCFVASRVGTGAHRQEAERTRGDRICWYDVDADADATDGRAGVLPGPSARALLARLEGLRRALNATCFLSLKSLECHAACYEPGAGYDAHVDVFAGSDNAGAGRVISFTHYLNPDWQPAHGGCLRMHVDAASDGIGASVDIEPRFDRLVVFQSRTMRHEVRPTTQRRWSSTGWMRG